MILTRKIAHLNINDWTFIVSSLFLLSLAIFSSIWFRKQQDATNWITHTYQVKLEIEKCFGLLLEAESNQRGFLLTKDTTFLRNISQAETSLKISLNQLDSLIVDNKTQVNNSNNFRSIILSRVLRLDRVLDSARRSNNSSVLYFASPGKLIMDSIYNQVKAMQAAEDKLLGQRTLYKLTEDSRLIIFIVLFSIIAFTILIWSFLKIRNENSLRIIAQSNAILLENEVNKRTLEIKHMNNQLRERNFRLERKNHDLTSFSFIASHDLKEPLRKIHMFTNLITLSNPDLQGKSIEYFNKISQQSNRMQLLIESVLKYAQTDDDLFGFQQTSLNETANLALASLNEKIKEKDAIIKVQSLPSIFCNPTQIEQLFINLIDNALKYAQPGVRPLIEINATRLEQSNDQNLPDSFRWRIDFSDNGIGFDDTYSEKIFEIFQRLHSNDLYPGTGIGLAICKKIVENHQGEITVKSHLGVGSVFSVILPNQII
jgi:signal transduction histidine kinase